MPRHRLTRSTNAPKPMLGIAATIERYTDEHFPGWVAFSFVDAAGVVHRFEEKVPTVTRENLSPQSTYPRPVVIGCEVISGRWAADGRELVLVDTSQPFGIESSAGVTRFEICRTQLTELNRGAG
jgi:hypothetical protein